MIHYDPELEGKTAKGKELNNITQKLKVLVEACLLKELGFSYKVINSLIHGHYQRYDFYKTSAE